METPLLKTHRELADHIAGKSVLLMNSLGKDSILCLEWLTHYAAPSRVVSVNYAFKAPHPGDAAYNRYLKRRYPNVEFREEPNPFEISKILYGVYQSPIQQLTEWNKCEHNVFDHQKMSEALRVELGCDYLCFGQSKYESFDRARYFHRKGLVDGHEIFPLGFMSKKQVHGLIKSSGFKLHPTYKLSKASLDKPSYYKMRSAFITSPDYQKKMFEVFPLLELDKYRYERLLK